MLFVKESAVELNEFYRETMRALDEEYRDSISRNNIVYRETIFTEQMMDVLSLKGLTVGEPQLCHHQSKYRNATLLLSGFAFSTDENGDGETSEGLQLDLYVSNFVDQPEMPEISDAENQKYAKQCWRFLNECRNGTVSRTIEPSSEVFELAEKIRMNFDRLVQIRIFVLTNGKAKNRFFKPLEVNGKSVTLEVVDLQRLCNYLNSGQPQDEIVVDFQNLCGQPLPCVYVAQDACDYDCILCSVPGEALYRVYEQYGDRLLEANVRSFLQNRKVNRGIQTTLRTEPLRFMAYNNGIVITASMVQRVKNENGYSLSGLQGMQIVNGGQTVASLFFTRKKYPETALSKVRIVAKILFLRQPATESETAENLHEDFISNVSIFSNSQNAVRAADLSSNRAFHVQMEQLAESVYCPDGKTRWFYERSLGKFNVMLSRLGTTPARLKKLKEERPAQKKLTKTDLAKYLFSWEQKPHLVSLGAQKNFEKFMQEQEVRPLEVTQDFFRSCASKAILFTMAHKALKGHVEAFLANVTTYLIAQVSRQFGDVLNLKRIWDRQALSPEFQAQLLTWGLEVRAHLQETANGRMISEWAKKPECWEAFLTRPLTPPAGSIPELRPMS